MLPTDPVGERKRATQGVEYWLDWTASMLALLLMVACALYIVHLAIRAFG